MMSPRLPEGQEAQLMDQGETLFSLGHFAQARICYSRTLELRPGAYQAMNNLGVIAYREADFEQSAAYFRQALDLHPRYIEAMENLANVLLVQGDYVQVAGLFHRAAESDMVTAELIRILTQCLILLRDIPSAAGMVDLLEKTGGRSGDVDLFRAWIRLHRFRKKGYVAKRSWLRQNADLVRSIETCPGLNMIRGRFWEYPFVFKTVMERPDSRILDIGTGNGVFAGILTGKGHRVVGLDNYRSCWSEMKDISKGPVPMIHADARDLSMIRDEAFDAALLISVIEHIPSNTIWCEKRQRVKTGPMLREEILQKVKVLSECMRLLRPGGRLLITSDIYLDHPAGVNISWKELIGLGGINREDMNDLQDVYITDNPIHKGRGIAVGIVIEKEEA